MHESWPGVDWCIDWRGEEPPGSKPYYVAPLFTMVEDEVTCFDIVPYVESAQRLEEVPRLTEQDLAALDVFKKTTWDEQLLVRIMQQPGDITFLNNHYHLHARSDFVDAEEVSEKRHLRRLWLETAAWGGGRRPKAMETLLAVSRSHWDQNSDGTVQIWDHM